MARLENTCDTGLASGTAVTASNSDDGGAGSAFATSKGATSTINYSNAWSADGSLSHLYTCASGESNFLQWLTSQGFVAAAQASGRFYFRQTDLPVGASSSILHVRNATTAMLNLQILADGQLRVLDSASNIIDPSGWFSEGEAPVLAINTEYRIEFVVYKGTTASDGRIRVHVFAGDSTDPIDTLDTGASVNTGTTDILGARFGRGSASATAHTYYMDEYVLQDGTTFVGPIGSNAAPSVTIAESQVADKNALVTISWTSADVDGVVASHTVSQISGPTVSLSGSGTSRTFTPTVPGAYTFSIRAVDDDGAQSEAGLHTVYVRDITARPADMVSNAGGFTNEGGAASHVAALADESDTTYIASPEPPSTSVVEFRMTPLSPGNVSVRTRNKASAASPAISRNIQLRQGATVIAEATINPLPTAATDHEFTTTPEQTAAITDRTALRVRITDTLA